MSLEYLDQFPSVSTALQSIKLENQRRRAEYANEDDSNLPSAYQTPPEVPRRIAMSGTITALRDEVHALKEERDQLLKYREVYRDRLHVAEGKVYDLEYTVLLAKKRAESAEERTRRAEADADAVRAGWAGMWEHRQRLVVELRDARDAVLGARVGVALLVGLVLCALAV